MSNVKYTTTHRLLSVILSVVMVIAAIPFSAISAFAGDLPEIEGITVVPADNLVYTSSEQALKVTVEGTQEGDEVYYSATGEDETWSEAELTGTDAKNYTVFVKVEREGYEPWVSEPTLVVIKKAEMTGVSVQSAGDLIYNGENQNLEVTVNGAPSGSTYQYSLKPDSAFSPNFPQGKEEGDYSVYVKVSCENYADHVFGPATVKIYTLENQATLTFKQDDPSVSVESENFTDGYVVDMSVTVDNTPVDGIVTYVLNTEAEGAEFNTATGELTVKEPGTYEVTATFDCGAAFAKVSKSFTLAVVSQGEYYAFAQDSVSFKLGESVPAVELNKIGSGKKWPTITYSINTDKLSIDQKSGKVSYDVTTLAEALEAGENTLTAVVKASSSPDKNFANEGEAFYSITVSFEDLPAVPYTVSGEQKDKESGWYTSDVTVTPADGYQIATAYSSDFQNYITISDNSTLWMICRETGAITAPFDFNVIDTKAPSEIKVEASCEPYAVKADSHYVFLEEVRFTIRATDAGSQPKHVEWTCVPENGDVPQTVGFVTDEKGYYTTISLDTDVFCGEVKFCVVDNAGNKTDEFTVVYNENDENEPYAAKDDGELKVFVVDKVAPNVTVKYNLTDENNKIVYASKNEKEDKYYFNAPEKVSVTFEVEEEFFFEEDFTLTVTNNDDPENPVEDYTLEWTVDPEGKHIGTLKLNKDACQNGAYTFTAEYKDPSQNPAWEDGYTSPYFLVVDTTLPVVSVDYQNDGVESVSEKDGRQYYPDTKHLVVTVKERNFDAALVVPTVASLDASLKDSGKITTATDYTKYLQDKNNWKEIATDTYQAVLTFNTEANYSFEVACADIAANAATTPDAKVFTVDKTAPVIQSVEYSKNLRDALLSGITCGFYNDKVTVTVTAFDATSGVNSFNYSYILADGVSGVNAGMESGAPETITYSPDGKTATMEFYVPKEALTANNQFNGTVKITAVDLSGNSSEKKDSYRLVVDNLAPKATVTFNKPVATVGGVDYYNGAIKGTITITEANFDSKDVEVLVSKNGTNQTAAVSWTDKDVDTHVGTFTLSDDADYVVGVKYTDKSDNAMTPYLSGKMTVDTTKPKATVTFNDAVNTTGGVAYYNGALKGTITVTDANFDAKSIKVVATKNGAAETPAVSWTDTNRNLHVGTFTLSADADYVINITGMDKATNAMTPYKSGKMTVDTKITAPTFTINGKAVNGNGGAYSGDVNVGFSFSDQNYSGYAEKDVTLTRIRFDKKDDVKKEFVNLSLNDKGGVGSFDIPKTAENDGIYILTVKMADKAQHSETSQLKFTINRFGSVYEYNDYLCALIANGGQYREKITEDLVVTEYNASPFTAGSLKVMITKDGEALDKVVTEEDDPKTESGWYKHVYVIKQSNFAEDGVYKITISSSDATGNTSTSVPDDLNKKIKGNSVGANGDPILDVMSFTVDDTDPEIRNIVNLENAIAKKSLIKDGKLTVEYALVDVGGLAKVEIFINGELVDTVDKFDNNQAYNGSFVINESNDIQTVRMVVTDLAGNVTDTASETFNPGDLYVFNDEVTVSTDFLVRFYRNAPLFWGSIGGVVAVLGGIILLIAKKKKKTDKTEKTDKE